MKEKETEKKEEAVKTEPSLQHDIVVAVSAAIAPVLLLKGLEFASTQISNLFRKRSARKEEEKKTAE